MKKVKNKNVGDTVTDDGYIDKTEVLEKGIRISPFYFFRRSSCIREEYSGKDAHWKASGGIHILH